MFVRPICLPTQQPILASTAVSRSRSMVVEILPAAVRKSICTCARCRTSCRTPVQTRRQFLPLYCIGTYILIISVWMRRFGLLRCIENSWKINSRTVLVSKRVDATPRVGGCGPRLTHRTAPYVTLSPFPSHTIFFFMLLCCGSCGRSFTRGRQSAGRDQPVDAADDSAGEDRPDHAE